jgi:CubicO group peptidase (beta-lactamase class C family)
MTASRDALAPTTHLAGQPPPGLCDTVRATMCAGRIPALSLAVVDRDRLLYAAGFGVADLATCVPATPRTAYLWFSMSKIVTATAAMRLVDEGSLDLDAPAAEYVPVLRIAGSDLPTVRQLLDHTAGLGNPLPLRWVHPAGEPGPDPAELLARLMHRRRAYRYPPGEAARYSNVGYLALGEVIAAASAVPFRQFVRQTVLEPLGMGRTGFGHQSAEPAAVGYVNGSAVIHPLLRAFLPRGVVGPRVCGRTSLRPFQVDGPAYGGLIGDVLDAGRFLRLHLGDGVVDGVRVLARSTAATMRQVDRPGQPFDHGLGWFRRPGPGDADRVEHLGAGAGFWNVMRLYPDRGLGVVVMTNGTTRQDLEPILSLVAAGR